jgi:mono/diheme cytochrome c family protein
VTRLNASFRRDAWSKAVLVSLCALGGSLVFAQSAPSAVTKRDRSGHDYAELAKAPEKWRTRENPLATDPDAVAAGRMLFEAHCAACHGETAAGGSKAPSLRAKEIQEATPGAIFWVLTNGVVRRGMPVWSKLPEPQRWQIVTYLKSLGPPAKPDEATK